MGKQPGRPGGKRIRPGNPQARRGRRTYHHGNLRRALVDAALDLVHTAGPQALTLRAAARRAGVSQAAPYRHFRDKRALLGAVAEEGFRALTREMRRAQAAEGADPVKRLRALGLAYVRFATRHPSHFRVMFGREVADKSDLPGLAEAANETFALLVRGITASECAGMFRQDNPEALAVAAWAMVHGLSALLVDGQLARVKGSSAEELAQIVTAALFFGIGAHAA